MTVVVIFVLLRFIDGIFLGGEYTSASPLAMEYCPREKRGLYGAVIMTGYPLAYATISLITMFLLFILPAGDLGSPYVQWGWRIPFLIGAALAFAFVIYFSRSVDESELWEETGGAESPLKYLFRGENLKNFLQVFVMMTGFWLTLYTGSAILPGVLSDPVGLSSTSLTITLVIANVVLAGAYVAAGVISQRTGRRPFLIVAGVIMAIVGTFLYYLLTAHKRRTAEPPPSHSPDHRGRIPRHLALGPCDNLHKRALPHQRARLGFRARLQLGGRTPSVLRLLPGWPGEDHALRIHRATPPGHRCHTDHRRGGMGTGDQERRFLGGRAGGGGDRRPGGRNLPRTTTGADRTAGGS